MVVVIIGGLVTACFSLFQGIHILRNRDRRPFFFEQSGDVGRAEPKLRLSDAVFLASIYILPAVGVFCILTVALFKNDPSRIIDWVTGHIFELFGTLIGLIYGLVGLFRPDVVLRHFLSNYHDRESLLRQASAQNYVRALGAFVTALTLYVFANM
jgi:hypothetical protein